ncbi:hypothetical protein K435DRAFT_962770 [Dendrothele bispora CBS 962.96]|uniref:Uncharacterized protein n=1 Tax=Dendrothele bispora (strain CBS 962.96) TaxID=1314807 RepID=A0A4S8MJ56_DENBC|nr:hypothetical protein K435DRAFT_962770 [Dendrothele bispora CBS 962.96]
MPNLKCTTIHHFSVFRHRLLNRVYDALDGMNHSLFNFSLPVGVARPQYAIMMERIGRFDLTRCIEDLVLMGQHARGTNKDEDDMLQTLAPLLLTSDDVLGRLVYLISGDPTAEPAILTSSVAMHGIQKCFDKLFSSLIQSMEEEIVLCSRSPVSSADYHRATVIALYSPASRNRNGNHPDAPAKLSPLLSYGGDCDPYLCAINFKRSKVVYDHDDFEVPVGEADFFIEDKPENLIEVVSSRPVLAKDSPSNKPSETSTLSLNMLKRKSSESIDNTSWDNDFPPLDSAVEESLFLGYHDSSAVEVPIFTSAYRSPLVSSSRMATVRQPLFTRTNIGSLSPVPKNRMKSKKRKF